MSWLHSNWFDICMLFAMWLMLVVVSYFISINDKEDAWAEGYKDGISEAFKSVDGLSKSPDITSSTHDRVNKLLYLERNKSIERYDVSDPLNPKLLDTYKL